MTWQPILANLINTVLVLLAVELLKMVIPKLSAVAGWLIPIIAAMIGPLIAVLQNLLTTWLGIPIDLSPIVAVFTGGSAVALYQIGHQLSKGGGK